jgi:CheY-like chemotaxis protein
VTATLLAVDDSKTMRKVLEITFAGEDYRMVLADSPADAMTKVKAERPVIALVDALLGGSSGYDLCQQIKADAPQVGVIVLSSKQHPYDRVRGGSVGADDFIDKPYDSQALIDKVAALSQKLASAPAPVARPQAVAAPLAPAAARPAPVAAGTIPGGIRTTMAFGTPAPASAVPVKPAPVAVPSVQPAPAAAQSAFAPRPAAAPVAAAPVAPAPAPVVHAAPVAAAAPAAPVAPVPAVAAPSPAALVGASMEQKLVALGLTKDQINGVLSLSREVVEQVVWEVVPVLAETMIREEIKRLTAE